MEASPPGNRRPEVRARTRAGGVAARPGRRRRMPTLHRGVPPRWHELVLLHTDCDRLLFFPPVLVLVLVLVLGILLLVSTKRSSILVKMQTIRTSLPFPDAA